MVRFKLHWIFIWLWRVYIVLISFVLIPLAAIAQDLGHGISPHAALLMYSFILTCFAIVNILTVARMIPEWIAGHKHKWTREGLTDHEKLASFKKRGFGITFAAGGKWYRCYVCDKRQVRYGGEENGN